VLRAYPPFVFQHRERRLWRDNAAAALKEAEAEALQEEFEAVGQRRRPRCMQAAPKHSLRFPNDPLYSVHMYSQRHTLCLQRDC
jgi:hypothetical protein